MLPGIHAIAVLGVTLVVFYLYTRSWIRMELVSLVLMLALVLIFHVFPFTGVDASLTDSDILAAFGHPALVAICCLMILGRGLTMTGALDPAVRVLGRIWKIHPILGLLVTLLLATGASAFVNDTPVLVMMLPMLLSLAKRTGYPASRTLMPVNFAILVGGMLTSIGTSTNLLVLSIAVDLGMQPIGLFGFTPIAATALLVALPYLWLVAPRLLPESRGVAEEVERLFEARIKVLPDNERMIGKSLAGLGSLFGRPLPAVALVRQGNRQEPPPDTTELVAGDVLIVRDTPRGLHELATLLRADLFERRGEGRFIESDDSRIDRQLAELVVGNDSPLIGRTLADVRFAEQHQVVVVGVTRGAESLLRDDRDIGQHPLAPGDMLLVQGADDRIAALRQVPGLLLLGSSLQLPRSPLARWALLVMVGVILAAATKSLPIHVAAFIGVIVMLLTGCVRLDGLGRALSLQVVLLVASSIALGLSLVSTGAAAWIAGGVSSVVTAFPPPVQLAVFMAFAALLTNFVSNSAAAAVGTPIAVVTAQQLGSPLEPFVLAVLFGANLSFATPMAYQTNILVMNAAGYRFADFVRVGTPLVLLMLGTLSWLLARRYGL